MKLQNFKRFVSTTFIILFLFDGSARAQQTSGANSNAKDIRVERLAGLAKVWGAVKFFHPYPAYREIDWDKALVETIPKVNAAKTAREYEAAVNSMLAALGDRNTRARIAAETPKTAVVPATETGAKKEHVSLQNGVLTIDGYAVARELVAANNRVQEFVAKTVQNVPAAKAVLIDLRSGAEFNEDVLYFLHIYTRAILPAMLDRNVSTSSLRYRIHNGYAPQFGSTSGDYYAGFITESPLTIAGNNKQKTPPIVFLVDEKTNFAGLLGGLQAAKIAFVVQEGESEKEAGVATLTIRLPENVEVEMRTIELVNSDGTIGFAADQIVPQGDGRRAAERLIAENKFVSERVKTASGNASQVSQKDRAYAEMEFPSAEYRLLGLFRFWNVINLFFPYKNLIDEPWDDVLPRYIPKFEANRDAADYQLTFREMVAEIQDSHGSTRGTTKSAERMGRFTPPVEVAFVENQTVVQHVFGDVKDVRVGDAITAVNGEPIEKFRADYARYMAASTPQALMRNIHADLLRGQENSRVKLTLRGADGREREVELARTIGRQDPRLLEFYNRERPLPVYTVLPSGYGYVDLGRLTVAEVDKMFEAIKNTSAVIFDMRGYPNGTAWEIAPRLTEKRSTAAAIFSRPIWTARGLSDADFTNGTNFTFVQKLPERRGDVYKGKVVMLIDENAQSQAEHTALFFEAATDVTFIGTPTAGANGDVTNVIWPGNLIAGFSGHDVRHADGRQLQRLGIQPHIRVAPTIRGLLLEKRDEMLEAAVRFLQTSLKK